VIQRIQTLYIILGILTTALAWFFIPIGTVSSDDSSIALVTYFKSDFGRISDLNWILFILILFVGLLSIMSFKYRKRQITLLRSLFAFTLCYPLGVISPQFEYLQFFGPPSVQLTNINELFNIMFLISSIFYFLAIKKIKQDDDLIKSIDRIR